MGRSGGTVRGPSCSPSRVERVLDFVVRAVGATTVRMLRTGVAGSAEGEGRPGTLVELARART